MATEAGAAKPPLVWRPAGEAGISHDLDDHNGAVVDAFSRLIKEGDRKAVTAALKRWPPGASRRALRSPAPETGPRAPRTGSTDTRPGWSRS